MPRLFTSPVAGFGSPPPGREGAASFASSSFTTPSPGFSTNRDDSIFGNTHPSSSSVRLSCSSPDGKAVHSLMTTAVGSCYIETHTLPLAGTVEPSGDETTFDSKAAIIRTHLPGHVTSALSRYPAIELLCVGGDSSATTTAAAAATPQRGSSLVALPLLCLYTKKDVFLLELCYEPTGAPEVEGTVSSIDEPYDDFLMSNSTVNIIRIQPAPQQVRGYATMCPSGTMAMLAQDQSTKFYSLTLYHGVSPSNSFSMHSPTTTHEIRTEALDDPMERIIDFCFCLSNKLSLLSSVTVAFLKGNGQILFATPIIFRGTVVASAAVSETLDFLEASTQCEKPYSAFFNQFAAAKRFFLDAFPNLGRSNFVTSALGTARNLQVFEWAVQIQGPLISLPPTDTDGNQQTAKSIVPFGGSGDLVGLAVGYNGEIVDIAVASPTVLVPRFVFESDDEAAELDADLSEGVCVDRVEIAGGESASQTICLIPDPILEYVVHLVTPAHVVSVSSNSAQITSNKAREDAIKEVHADSAPSVFSPPSKSSDLKQKTTVWSCLDVSLFQGTQNPLVGAVVSNNTEFGHILVARLRNGKMIAVNLTEKRHLHELNSLSELQSKQVLAITGGSQEAESLADVILPLIDKVHEGLANMAQIGGTSTAPEDVSVDILAGAMSIYEARKKEIYLPLVEMDERVVAKLPELKEALRKQQEAVQALKDVIAKLREKQFSIEERMGILSENSKSLEKRCASAQQSCKDLQPTITQAEYDFFQEVKRLDEKTKAWKGETDILKLKATSNTDSIESGTTTGPMNLSEENLKNAEQILKGTETYIDRGNREIQSLSRKVGQLAALTGYLSQGNSSLPLNR